MRTEYLLYFVKTVDIGSINKAANALFISPQGLSQAIQKLEQEVGTPLFFRDGNKLELSAAGKEAYDFSIEILEKTSHMIKSLSKYRKAAEINENQLTILSAPIITSTFLPSVLAKLRKEFPDINLLIEETDPHGVLEHFVQTPNAISIFSMPELEMENLLKDKPQALNFSELFRSPLMAAVSVNSNAVHKDVIKLNEFQNYPIVLFGVEDRLLNHLMLDTDLLEIAFRSSNLEICRHMIATDERSIGFTNSLPEKYIKNADIKTIPLSPSVDMVTGFLISPDFEKAPPAQALIKIMREEIERKEFN
ncbi:MAG: LysR family transcriptional regulator [Eubacterium sp.]|nr:LysR family transcriptional regulator [Eubacterium sp.]